MVRPVPVFRQGRRGVRIRLPIVLLLCAGIAGLTENQALPQNPGGGERIHYRKQREFFMKFEADPNRPITELRLFVQRNGGEWEYLTSAKPTQKGFNFYTNQDGNYGMTVQT